MNPRTLMNEPCQGPSRTVVLFATLGAILLANVFFWGHGPTVIHDSRGYYELSKVIRQSGLFWCADDLQIINSDYAILFKLRTYGYPLVVALCSLFTSQDLVTVQI